MKRPFLLSAMAAAFTWGCTVVSAPSAAPSAVPSAASSAAPSSAIVDDGIPVCDTIPITTAPEDAFRDSPIYVANEMPTEEIKVWAQTKPGFEDLWIDRDHGGWVVVAFSTDAAARQAELANALPGVGVVAVQVDWKRADLERLQQRVVDELSSEFESLAVGLDILRGRVSIGIGVLSEDRIAIVRSRFAGEPVCVSGIDPSDAIPEGPQPTSGNGWRLLANEKSGEAYRTGIATEDSAYRGLWDRIGLPGDPPPVDFDAEVVIWFGAVYGSSCPDIRLDGVVFDHDRHLLHGTIVLPSTSSVCTSDANPHAFVVAVERAKLPPPPFGIQLGAEAPPAGVPEERTIVEADLRERGSVLRPGDAHPDPSLPEPWVVESGSVIEPGFEVPFRLDVRCGAEWLGRLNDLSWRTEVPAGADRFLPPEWMTLVVDDTLTVSILLVTDPEPMITATAEGYSVEYRPTREGLPPCP